MFCRKKYNLFLIAILLSLNINAFRENESNTANADNTATNQDAEKTELTNEYYEEAHKPSDNKLKYLIGCVMIFGAGILGYCGYNRWRTTPAVPEKTLEPDRFPRTPEPAPETVNLPKIFESNLIKNYDKSCFPWHFSDLPFYKNFIKPMTKNSTNLVTSERLKEEAESIRIVVPQGFSKFIDGKQLNTFGHFEDNADKKILWLYRARPFQCMEKSDTAVYLDEDNLTLKYDHKFNDFAEKSNGKYLSYNNGLKYSPFVCVSGKTTFINDGNKFNRGEVNKLEIKQGAFIGAVGMRFEKKGEMEDWYCRIVNKDLAKHKNKLNDENANLLDFLRLEGKDFNGPVNDSAKFTVNGKEFSRFQNWGDDYFDWLIASRILKKRIECIYFEAAQLANDAGKRAFIHQTGLGDGVWANELPKKNGEGVGKDMLQRVTYQISLAILNENPGLANHIACVHFSCNPKANVGSVGHIKITKSDDHNSDANFRNPSAKLPEGFKDCLLVTTFAWDGWSYVGNEYFGGQLQSSMDPAFACSCSALLATCPELNPGLINQSRIVEINKNI